MLQLMLSRALRLRYVVALKHIISLLPLLSLASTLCCVVICQIIGNCVIVCDVFCVTRCCLHMQMQNNVYMYCICTIIVERWNSFLVLMNPLKTLK